MVIVPALAGEITCAPSPDGFGLLLTATDGALALEFLARQAGDSCNDALFERIESEAGVSAWLVQARDAATARPLDIVSSFDGRLYVGDAGTQLRCPPCAVEAPN